jgi:hypothetical protein
MKPLDMLLGLEFLLYHIILTECSLQMMEQALELASTFFLSLLSGRAPIFI